MAKESKSSPAEDLIEVDLREPGWAALFAWLWPGAGHLYQRRYAKGILFMACVLSTYFFGLTLGGGHCVYASFNRSDFRWQYICQLGVGAPALPAAVQYVSVKNTGQPLFVSWMAPPKDVDPERPDELSAWHLKYSSGFEMGTLFTVVAGLLNILAIYDAYAGPMSAAPEDESDKPPDKDKPGEKAK